MPCCAFHKRKVQGFHNIPKNEENDGVTLLKNKRKRNKRRSIYPASNIEYTQSREDKKPIKTNKVAIEERHQEREAFTKKFLAEIIHCGACKEKFCLGDHELKINCGSCNQFFHCSIAGACVGPNCSIILDGKKESLKYCMGCVNPYLRINVMDNGQALCKTCENDPLTDKIHLRV